MNFLLSNLEWQEDIKLPAKVDVELRPSDTESWYTVQSLAQNPRVKTSLPLQKRLISLIKTLQLKWKSRDAKMVSNFFFELKLFAQNLNLILIIPFELVC